MISTCIVSPKNSAWVVEGLLLIVYLYRGFNKIEFQKQSFKIIFKSVRKDLFLFSVSAFSEGIF